MDHSHKLLRRYSQNNIYNNINNYEHSINVLRKILNFYIINYIIANKLCSNI